MVVVAVVAVGLPVGVAVGVAVVLVAVAMVAVAMAMAMVAVDFSAAVVAFGVCTLLRIPAWRKKTEEIGEGGAFVSRIRALCKPTSCENRHPCVCAQSEVNIGCDPPDYPTAAYIDKHSFLYGEPVAPLGKVSGALLCVSVSISVGVW
eukprot:5485883-Pleurochrysis_carterae.AAC.1